VQNIITIFVQVVAVTLLPAALVFLILLLNDKAHGRLRQHALAEHRQLEHHGIRHRHLDRLRHFRAVPEWFGAELRRTCHEHSHQQCPPGTSRPDLKRFNSCISPGCSIAGFSSTTTTEGTAASPTWFSGFPNRIPKRSGSYIEHGKGTPPNHPVGKGRAD
jgi:hypothetical protein